MGKLLYDLEGKDLPKPEGYCRLGGMVRPLVTEAVLEPKPVKILERPAEPLAEVKAVEVRSGRGRPKKEGRRPWEEAGMSKSTWYDKKSKGEV
jgi:hypothetical protein